MRNVSTTVTAPRKPHGKFKISRMSLTPGASGGFTAEHSFEPVGMRNGEPGGYKPSQTHVIPHMKALHKHLDKHFGNMVGAPAAAQEPMEEMPAAQGQQEPPI